MMMRPLRNFLLGVFFLGVATAAAAQAITLPDTLAIEMPRGVTQIAPNEFPLRELLSGARSGSLLVTHDLKTKVGAGPVQVIWSAWPGAPGVGKPVATKTARVFIFPFGMTPVGVSADENATAGNNAVHIARDATGRVHMVWQDGGRQGGKVGPVYRRAFVGPDSVVRFETGPVYLAGDGPSDWNAYPALAVSGPDVQIVWQGGGTVRTRRISREANGWITGPVMDTGAKSEGRDVGPAVTMDSRGRIHVVTPDGAYAVSVDGLIWQRDRIPAPANQVVKTPSVAVDAAGNAHVAFAAPLNRAAGAPPGGYWQLRTIERTPDGKWINAANVLDGMKGWGPPAGNEDVLADWARIAIDHQGGLHLAWHGTVNSRKYAQDEAFYASKKPGQPWQAPVLLVPQAPYKGIKYSYAPSLAFDGDRTYAMVFYDIYSGGNQIGFDSSLAILRNGRLERQALPVNQFTQQAVLGKRPATAMGPRFSTLAPTLWRARDGQMAADVLEAMQSSFTPTGPNIVVYRRVDVSTGLVPN